MPSTPPHPPDPPQNVDIIMEETEGKNKKHSFKEILTDKAQDLNKSFITGSYFPPKANIADGESIITFRQKQTLLMGNTYSYQILTRNGSTTLGAIL